MSIEIDDHHFLHSLRKVKEEMLDEQSEICIGTEPSTMIRGTMMKSSPDIHRPSAFQSDSPRLQRIPRPIVSPQGIEEIYQNRPPSLISQRFQDAPLEEEVRQHAQERHFEHPSHLKTPIQRREVTRRVNSEKIARRRFSGSKEVLVRQQFPF